MALLSGWDASMEKPKDLEDVDEVKEMEELEGKKGYFAKYEKIKSLRHAPNAPVDIPGTGLTRVSAPLPHGVDDHHLSPASAEHGSVLLSRRSQGGGNKGTFGSLDRSPTGYTKPRTGVATDWESELQSLKPLNKCTTMPASYSTAKKPTPTKEPAWWQRMDAGALNSVPDSAVEEEVGRPGTHKGSFTPQYNLTGQGNHFIVHDEATVDH